MTTVRAHLNLEALARALPGLDELHRVIGMHVVVGRSARPDEPTVELADVRHRRARDVPDRDADAGPS